VNANQVTIPVSVACRTLGVSVSGYYAWAQRAPSQRALDDAVLTERIRAIHLMSDGNYGSPNIHAELRDEGTRVGRKRVARLMRLAGIRGVSRRRGFVVTTQRDPKWERVELLRSGPAALKTASGLLRQEMVAPPPIGGPIRRRLPPLISLQAVLRRSYGSSDRSAE
jgi:transposase InsO family protein